MAKVSTGRGGCCRFGPELILIHHRFRCNGERELILIGEESKMLDEECSQVIQKNCVIVAIEHHFSRCSACSKINLYIKRRKSKGSTLGLTKMFPITFE
jgi:hypothetical protein